MFRVLAIDGGGIRGIVAAHWLQALEAKANKPLAQCFDLIAGTSTGAILGAAIASGIAVKQIVTFYAEEGPKIFKKRVLDSDNWGFPFLPGLLNPKYGGEPLESCLKSTFSIHREMQTVETNLLIITYDVFTRRPVLMRSYDPEFQKVPIWEACKASSSAPVYFPAHVLTPDQDSPGKMYLIDGGVLANNPSALAIAEAVRLMKGDHLSACDEICLVSVGTGSLTRAIQEEEALHWGGMRWVMPLIDVVFDATSDSVGLICERLLKKENYHRLQVELRGASDDLDNSEDSNLTSLVNVANGHLQSDPDILDRILACISMDR